jgi:hypothetical protein
MAKFSDKRMGKEVGNAMVYAKPHTMSGAPVGISQNPGTPPNRSKADTINMSVGNISKAAGNETTKTSGIVTRGNGAATKGTMARGPMA